MWDDEEIVFPVLTERKLPKPLVANAIHALREHNAWVGVLAFDTFSMRTATVQPPPWETKGNAAFTPRAWIDTDDILLSEWLQHRGVCVGPEIARQAVEVVCRRQGFHPVVDYLDGLKWDGRARLENLASDYFGAAKTPYTAEVSGCFLIGAVARVKQPGCKADAMPVLEGQQDIGKSSVLAALFDPWFSDEMADPGSKDAAMQLQGAWCIEIAELDAFSKAETTRIKAFLSRRKDRFRPPYGSRVDEFPRQCVFAGTSNQDDYLKDATGGRRFWPIRCGRIDIDSIHRDRDQLWAEARAHYEAGERWWFDRHTAGLATKEQAERYVGDVWTQAVLSWVAVRDFVTVPEILEQVLDAAKARWTQAEQNRISAILKAERYSSGAQIWKRTQKRIDGKQTWGYLRQPDPDEEVARLEAAVTRLQLVTGGER